MHISKEELLKIDAMNVLPGMFAVTYGMYVPSALVALGACAGFAAQMAVWKELIVPQSRNAGDFIIQVKDKDHHAYYLGDAINHFLFSTFPDRFSYLTFAGGAVQPPEPMPEIKELAAFKAASIGTPAFGHPRLPDGIKVHESSFNALLRTWKNVKFKLESDRHPPREWPCLLGLVAWLMIRGSKTPLSPATALRLTLEAALSMSAVDPALVSDAEFKPLVPEQWSRRALDGKDFSIITEEVRQVMPDEASLKRMMAQS